MRRGAPTPVPPASRRADALVSDWGSVVRDADRPATAVPSAPAAPTASPRQAPPTSPPAPAGAARETAVALSAPPDVNRVAERWDDLVAALRAAGKSVCATALEHAAPVTVNARGEVTIALDEANPIYEQALEAANGELAGVLRQWFGGVQRVSVRPAVAGSAPPARLTDEMVRSERLTALRRRDPVLGAAIDALDLDLAD
jgi:hypothetical protein